MCMLSHLRHVHLFATLWTVVHQAPLFMGFTPSVGEQGPRRGGGPLLLGPGFIVCSPPGRGQVHVVSLTKRVPHMNVSALDTHMLGCA